MRKKYPRGSDREALSIFHTKFCSGSSKRGTTLKHELEEYWTTRTVTVPYTSLKYVKGFSVGKRKPHYTQEDCNGKCRWSGVRGVKNWHRCVNCGTEELIK